MRIENLHPIFDSDFISRNIVFPEQRNNVASLVIKVEGAAIDVELSKGCEYCEVRQEQREKYCTMYERMTGGCECGIAGASPAGSSSDGSNCFNRDFMC